MCDTVVEETAVDTSNTVINAADTAELLTEQADEVSKLSSKSAAENLDVNSSSTMDADISTTVSANNDAEEELYTNAQQISGEYALASYPIRPTRNSIARTKGGFLLQLTAPRPAQWPTMIFSKNRG